MKKIWLIAFLLYGSNCFAQKTAWVTGESFSIPFIKIESFQTKEKYNFALFINSQDILPKVKLIFITGNISSQGLISKLNNPNFSSTIAPFSELSNDVLKINCNYSGTTNFSKPISYFFESTIKGNKIGFSECIINGFFNREEKYIAGSAKIKFDFSKLKLSLSFCSGLFEYEKLKSTSWFLEENYYKNGINLDSIIQFGINTKIYKGVYSINFYETPFSSYKYTYKIENSWKNNKTNFNIGFFYNPQRLFTSSQKILEEQLQFRTGINYSKIKLQIDEKKTEPLLIKYGINFYNELEKQTFGKIKTSAGISFIGENKSLNINCNLALNFIRDPVIDDFYFDFIKGGITFKDSFILNNFKIWLGGTINYENNKQILSEKLNTGVNFTKKGNINFLAAISFSTEVFQKGFNFDKVENSLSISGKFECRWITFTSKLNINF